MFENIEYSGYRIIVIIVIKVVRDHSENIFLVLLNEVRVRHV